MAKSFPNTGATVGLAADRSALTSPFAGMQFFETDTKALYLYDGSAWVSMLDTDTPPALQLIKPTSVSGTGVSLSGFKTVISSATSATINGVFSSAFTSYQIFCSRMGTTTYPYISYQLCAAGTANTGTYGSGRISGQTSTPPSYNIVGGTSAPFMAGGNSFTLKPNTGTLTLDGPFLTGYTAFTSLAAGDYAQVEIFAGIHQVSTSFDGIKIFASDNSAFIGNIIVYGVTGS